MTRSQVKLPPKPQPAGKDTGVRRVVQFQARDGTCHATYAAAQRHNAETAFACWIDEYLDANMAYGELHVSAAEIAAAIRAVWAVTKRKTTKE